MDTKVDDGVPAINSGQCSDPNLSGGELGYETASRLSCLKAQVDASSSSGVVYMDFDEDWDNGIVNNDHKIELNNPRTLSDDIVPDGMSQAYLLKSNFSLGATGKNDFLCEETLSTCSSDSDAWGGKPSKDHPRSYEKSSLHFLSEREWLDELESLYFSDMITELKSLLLQAFEASKDCFDFVLFIVKFADFDIQSGKKSLAYLTLVEFEAWLKSKTEGRGIEEVKLLGYWPTDNHKDLALDVVVSSTFLLFEPIKRTFQLDVGDNGFLAKHVRFLMHSKRRYREVSTIFNVNLPIKDILNLLLLQTCFKIKHLNL